jgi:hypothetical protein
VKTMKGQQQPGMDIVIRTTQKGKPLLANNYFYYSTVEVEIGFTPKHSFDSMLTDKKWAAA